MEVELAAGNIEAELDREMSWILSLTDFSQRPLEILI